MVRNFQHVDMDGVALPVRADLKLQPLQNLVAAGVAGEQDRLAAELRKHDDAGKVRHRLVDIGGQRSGGDFLTLSSSATPRASPGAPQLRLHRAQHSEGEPRRHLERLHPRRNDQLAVELGIARNPSSSASPRKRYPCSMLASTFRDSSITSGFSWESSSTVSMASSAGSPPDCGCRAEAAPEERQLLWSCR